jgi:hypothetical protein
LLTAVLAGFIFGTGISFILQTVSGVALSWLLMGTGVRTEDLYSAMAESPVINVWAHILNVAAVMSAGAGSALLRPSNPFMAALLVGGVMLGFVVLQFIVPYEHQAPLWSKLASLAIPVPAAIAGAWLWKIRAA